MQPLPERLAALEERVLNIKAKLDEIAERVDEIHSLIQRGKGAKWVIITLVSAISSGIGMVVHKVLPF